MANRFGLTGADVIVDLFGNVQTSTATVHATEADATGNANVIATVTITAGRWSYTHATLSTVWLRLVDGTVWPIQSPDSAKLAQTANLSDVTAATTARVNLGLGNVDNTSDAAKPVSTAAAAAIALKQDKYAHPTMSKLARGAEAVTIAVLSDSTGQTQLDTTKRWPRLLCEQIAAQFPAYTVVFHEWTETSNTYNGATYPDVTIQTGTGTANAGGPYVLDFYNGSISGAIGVGILGVGTGGTVRYGPLIGNLNCDLIFGSFGQNNALTDNDMQMASVFEPVALDNPTAAIVLIAQNPNLNDARQAVHATTVERYARTRGFGFVDVYKVFTDAGSPLGWYVGDGIHPSITGSTAWANAVYAYLQGTQFPQQQSPTLATCVESLLTNADFLDVGTSFKNWTLNGGAVGLGNQAQVDKAFVGGLAVSNIKLTAPVANAAQSISQTISVPPSWRGHWFSTGVRLWVPTIANGGSSTAGIVVVTDGTNSVSAGAWGTSGKGAWVWVHVPMKLSAAATTLTVTIYSEYSTTNASTTGYIYIDRVVCCPGNTLREMPLRRNSVFVTNVIARRSKWAAAEGSTNYQGVATLAAGTVTVSNTAIVAGDRVRLTGQSSGGGVASWGELAVTTITAGTSFVITSASATDTRTVLWEIIGNAT